MARGCSAKLSGAPAFSYHCTVGVGAPEAAAVNVTELLTATVWLIGCVMIFGTASETVRPTALVVTLFSSVRRVGEDGLELFAAVGQTGREAIRRRRDVALWAKVPPIFGLIHHCTRRGRVAGRRGGERHGIAGEDALRDRLGRDHGEHPPSV